MTNLALNSLQNPETAETKTIFFILLAVLVGNIGLVLFKQLHCGAVNKDNAVGGIFFGAVSVLYSLILAFVIMAEWDDFHDLNENIILEGDKLNNIIAHSANLPDSIKATIGHSIADYCIQVISREWSMQEPGTVDHPSAIPAMRRMLLSTMPTNKLEENALKVIDDDLSALTDLRRNRLHHTRSRLPPLIWCLLESGAVLLVVFSYHFHVSSARRQHLYLSFLVCLLAMCLSIIYNLDHPFVAGSGLENGFYQKVMSEVPFEDVSTDEMAYLRYWQGR